MSQKIQPWTDQVPLDGSITLLIFATNSKAETEILKTFLGLACIDQQCVWIHSADLGKFLFAHRDASFFCINAVGVHSCLHTYFLNTKESDAITVLWELVQQHQLFDLQFMEQQLVRGKGDTLFKPDGIASMLQRHEVNWNREQKPDDLIDGSSLSLQSIMDGSSPVLSLIEKLHKLSQRFIAELRSQNEELVSYRAEQVHACYLLENVGYSPYDDAQTSPRNAPAKLSDVKDSNAKSKCAHEVPFPALGIEVQGEVVIRHLEQSRLQINLEKWEAAHFFWQKQWRKLSHELCNRSMKDCFVWHGDSVMQLKNGRPALKTKLIRRWLERESQQLTDRHLATIRPPRTSQGHCSIRVEDWKAWIYSHSDLLRWWNLTQTGMALSKGSNPTPISFQYQGTPLLGFRELDLGWIRAQQEQPLFRSAEGHQFLTLRIPLLRHSCFSQLCSATEHPLNSEQSQWSAYSPQGRLNECFHAPNENYFSDEFRVSNECSSRRLDDGGLSWFDKVGRDMKGYLERRLILAQLRSFPQEKFISPQEKMSKVLDWTALAIALVELEPFLLIDEDSRRYLRDHYEIDLPIDLLFHCQEFLRSHLNEFQYFTFDNLVTVRRSRGLGYELGEYAERLQWVTEFEKKLQYYRAQKIRPKNPNDVGYRAYVSEQIKGLEELLHGNTGLSWLRRTTPLGTIAQVRTMEYLMTVDELIKAIAFRLIRNGHPLCAIVRDTFLLEYPLSLDQGEMIDDIHRLVNEVQLSIFPSDADPLACEFIWQTEW